MGEPMNRIHWVHGLLMLTLAAMTAVAQQRTVRLGLIPPSPVTDKITLDIRGAIQNDGSLSLTYKASLYLDRETPEGLLCTQQLAVLAHASSGIYCRHSTAGWAGTHTIILVVRGAGGSIRAKRELEVLASDVRSTRTIGGAWAGIVHWSEEEGRYWNADLRKLTDGDWLQQIRGMHDLGMNTVVIQEVFRNQAYYNPATEGGKPAYAGLAYYPSALYPGRMQMASPDSIEAILTEADRLHMQVFLGVGMYGWFDFSGESLTWHKQVAEELWHRYGRHASFYGWYVSEEAYGNLIPDQGKQAAAQYRREMIRFFAEFQAFCRSLAPEKPVMLAPNTLGLMESKDVWPQILAHVDIICPFAFARMPEGDLTSDQAASLWQEMCDKSGSHLWMDLEAFSFEGPALIPRPIDGVAGDLQRFTAFEKVLCYQYPGLFNSPESRIKPGGAATVKLYRDYQEYRRRLAQTTQK